MKILKLMGSVDRISELPDFILHMILSLLDTREACRASVLSKTWCKAWCSIPVLDFRHLRAALIRLRDNEKWYEYKKGQIMVGVIDKIMQRYFEQEHRIRKFYLDLPRIDEKIEHLVDKWIEIAVHNQVEELSIKTYSNDLQLCYKLPKILFSAKTLKVLKCEHVKLPYYEAMDLISLESFTVLEVSVYKDMLQKIITFCPLIDLHIRECELDEISLPWMRKDNESTEYFVGGLKQSNVKTSMLRKFVYHGLDSDGSLWPWNINMAALRNLRKVEIGYVKVTDDVVSELASGLVVLESLKLYYCPLLECIKISSISLKKFHITQASSLDVTVDAPNLIKFWCNIEVWSSLSIIRVRDCCNAHFCPFVDIVDTCWFTRLKELLIETRIFKCLEMDLECYTAEIEVEEEILKNSSTDPPYKLRELKLLKTQGWDCEGSSLTAFVDGVFWCCRPDVLSITTTFHNETTKSIINILKDMVKSWKHPLKNIEVDVPNLLLGPCEVEIRLRLSWAPIISV